MKPKELTSLAAEVFEVSLVGKGANKKKRFPICKEESAAMNEIIDAVLKTEFAEEEKILSESVAKDLDEKAGAALTSAVRLFAGFKDVLPKDAVAVLAKAAGFPTEEPVAKAAVTCPKCGAEFNVETETETETEGEMPTSKSMEGDAMSDEIRKELDEQLTALRAENEQIRKSLKDEQDARVLATWKERVSKDLAHYPGKSFDEMAQSLKRLSDVDPSIAEDQFATMKAASAALALSPMLREAGRVNKGTEISADDSAWDKIVKMANGLVQKSADINLTEAKAIDAVLKTEAGRKLYAEHQQENPVQEG